MARQASKRGTRRKSAPTQPSTPGYRVRWPSFHYGDPAVLVDRGQLIDLVGGLNDEPLLRLGYIEAYTGSDAFTCAECGAQFSRERELADHGQLRHSGLSPDEIADRVEKQTERAQRQTPLHLEKSIASQEA